MGYKRHPLKRPRKIRAGEFEINISKYPTPDGKHEVSVEHKGTMGIMRKNTESYPMELYGENIEYLERELKRGVIHEDLVQFDEPFLEQYEETHEHGKVVRKRKEKEKIVRKKLPNH